MKFNKPYPDNLLEDLKLNNHISISPEELDDMLKLIDDKNRKALLLWYRDNITISKIAIIENKANETIRQRIRKGRYQIKKQYVINNNSKDENIDENNILNAKLTSRTKNILYRNRIRTITDLKKLSEEDILKLHGVGQKILKEILNFINNIE